MGFFNFFLKKTEDGKEEAYTCSKCGKEKDKSQGVFIQGGSSFCCKQCCDTTGEKKEGTCEFC
ncbi:MAG: hypothetical protein HYT22_03070 [Candidatus Niyogibacteria bacterium]|nr:hypothetical protein [Candidatus Niyogibacteria bacterium]